ncbi:MAG: response regulator [Proteobacteria bacterium]|nr:response regulator [Pseudomonadota bacterium]MBU1686159.1 response regulator [Pseudomonadota bacterium]
MFHFMQRITVKYAAITLVVAVIPLLGFGWFSLQKNKAALSNQVIMANMAIAARGVERVAVSFTELEKNLDLALRTLALHDMDLDDLEWALATLRPVFVEAQSQSIFDGEGHEVIRFDRDRLIHTDQLLDRSKDPLLIQALHGEIGLGPVYVSVKGTRRMELAVPIKDPSGRVVRVLLTEISLRNLLQQIASLQVGEDGAVMVLDRNGRLIAHTDHRRVFSNEVLMENPFRDHFMAGDKTAKPHQYVNHDGIEVLGAGAAMNHPDWLVVVEVSTNEAFRSFRAQTRLIVVSLLLLLLCTVMLAIYLSFKLSGPLRTLEEGAEQIGQGNLEVTIPVTSADEVGRVSASFNLMAGNLSNSQKEKREEEWFRSGRLLLDEQMRGEGTVKDLAGKILSFLAGYLDFPIGVFFVKKSGEGGDSYCCAAGHAFDPELASVPAFRPGDGLVGQAVERQQPLSFTAPEKYLTVRSGLGRKAPEYIYLQPLIDNREQVVGVIEIGSFEVLKERARRFLSQSAQSIAIALTAVYARDETERALQKAQILTEELQTQQEELRVANEELEEQTQRLQSSEEELRVANEELEERAVSLTNNSEEMIRQNFQLESARKILEQKSLALEVTSRYKSEFLANMSHELRTPLNSLLILSQDLVGNKDKNLTPEQVESAEIIFQSGNDLLKLINDVLDISKIEAGKVAVNFEMVPIAEVARQVETIFRRQAEAKGLKLEVHQDPALPPMLMTDQQRLEQILRNLLSNALKFTESGLIKVEFKHLAGGGLGDLAGSPGKIAISVTDTGIGVPEEKQLDIFEAFQQVDGGISRKYGGTGLGLSISRELARLLGGELTLVSAFGRGSVFTLVLPLAAMGSDARNKQDQVQLVSGEPSEPVVDLTRPAAPMIPDDRDCLRDQAIVILVIEDDLNFARTLYEFSHRRGFQCLHAGDGETGLLFAEKYQPDAIILDIKLPGIQGYAVLDALKGNSRTRHIPVHVMSVDERSMKAFESGVVGYLEKPVSLEELDSAFTKIEEILSGKARKLLVVEDSDNQRKSIIRLIGNNDVTSTGVASGREALQKLKKEKFDCMILDLTLPDMTGFELLEEMNRGDLEAVPPVIVYTGKELTREEVEKLQKYASSIIIKGVMSPERLLDETALFLHRVVQNLPPEKKEMIVSQHHHEEGLAGRKILIVDDDMRNVFALAKVLSGRGMIVLKAANGRKALDILDKEPGVSLVLMDIMMPEMDGYTAMKKIRESPKFYRCVPIIALTAKVMKDDREKCLEAGANDYLAKPVEIEKLLSLVRVWLQRGN